MMIVGNDRRSSKQDFRRNEVNKHLVRHNDVIGCHGSEVNQKNPNNNYSIDLKHFQIFDYKNVYAEFCQQSFFNKSKRK